MQDMVTVKILGMTWVSTYRRVTLEGLDSFFLRHWEVTAHKGGRVRLRKSTA